MNQFAKNITYRKPVNRIRVFILLGLLSLIWGSTWLVIKQGLQDLPPFFSAGLRFLIAAVIMSVLAPILVRKEGGQRPSMYLTLTMGLGNFSISYGIVYWSETILPSGLVSVLWSIFPMLMAVSGHLFLPGERLRARQWFGFVMGFSGVVLLFLTDLKFIGKEAVFAGAILIGSPLISAVGQTIVKKHGQATSSVLLNRNGMYVGALCLLVAGFFCEPIPQRWTAQAIGSVIYLSLFGTVIAFGLYFWLLRSTPAYQMSLIAYIVPFIALTLGIFLGNEPVGIHTISGMLLILLGVGFVLRKRA